MTKPSVPSVRSVVVALTFPLLIRGGTSGKGAAWCPVRGGAWDEPDLVGGWDGTSSIGGSHNPAAQCA